MAYNLDNKYTEDIKSAICFKDYSDFKPNLSPFEVLALGSYCDQGGYFRPIYSQVIGKKLSCEYYKWPILEEYKKYLPCGLSFNDYIKKYVSLDTPKHLHNRFKVKCGKDLLFWESKGWIKSYDPYGWFQWYCHFYYGRRIAEYDTHQIARWRNIVNRFNTYTPKVQQVLQHWAFTHSSVKVVCSCIRMNLKSDNIY